MMRLLWGTGASPVTAAEGGGAPPNRTVARFAAPS